ncbi:hypothetical protein [Crossiella sp. CA198]|uniref:hypothetical protein n=1 Tax=Crossiella sp. CA198 TaxID=3455607 RepID=UPI003F8D80DB
MSTLPGIPGLPERVSPSPLAQARDPRLRSPMLLGAGGGALICVLATVLLMPVSVVGDSVLAMLFLAGLIGAGAGMLAGATLGLLGLTGPVPVGPAEPGLEAEPELEPMPAPRLRPGGGCTQARTIRPGCGWPRRSRSSPPPNGSWGRSS